MRFAIFGNSVRKENAKTHLRCHSLASTSETTIKLVSTTIACPLQATRLKGQDATMFVVAANYFVFNYQWQLRDKSTRT